MNIRKVLFTALSSVSLFAASTLVAGSVVQLQITEAMSSSGVTPDWIEITNFGVSTVDLSGYTMDDSSADFTKSVALNGISSIAAGESVVFIESNTASDITDFRTFWGNIDSVQIGSYSGSGVGLSSNGDGVAIFDGNGSLLSTVRFGAATSGVSFGYNTSTSMFGDLSVAGQFGAFVSADAAGNVGSPGTISSSAVPEPSSYAALCGIAFLGFAAWRRRRA